MKSPITGKAMERRTRPEELEFRKEKFSILSHFYWDKDANEEFTNEELETIKLTQVYNQYREKYNLPFPDQIKSIREQYGLTQAKMAEVLGFGVNMYRQYENGEMPTLSNARLIQIAADPAEFKKLVEKSIHLLDENTLQDLLLRVDKLIMDSEDFRFNGLPEYLMSGGSGIRASKFTGYKSPSLRKLLEMVVYFATELKPFKTQLNKLLFYADFCHYKRTATSISGAEYYAIKMGPVPNNFNSIFEYAATTDMIDIEYHDFDGRYGEQFKSHKGREFNKQLFSQEELDTLAKIKDLLGSKTTKEIINISHQELAWIANSTGNQKISYDYAFQLIHA